MPKFPASPRQLLLAKQLFDEGKRYAALGGKLASMKALLLLDLAVEQMLNAVISDCSSEELLNLDDANWHTLWTKASAAAKNRKFDRLPNSRALQKRSDPPEIRRVATEVSARMKDLAKALQQREEELLKQIVIGNLGVSAAETGRFQRTQRFLVVRELGDFRTWTIYARGGRDAEMDADARFAIEYVTSLALLAQEAHPAALEGLQLRASLSDQDFWLQRRPGVKPLGDLRGGSSTKTGDPDEDRRDP